MNGLHLRTFLDIQKLFKIGFKFKETFEISVDSTLSFVAESHTPCII
jgi:hypothetical protein